MKKAIPAMHVQGYSQEEEMGSAVDRLPKMSASCSPMGKEM